MDQPNCESVGRTSKDQNFVILRIIEVFDAPDSFAFTIPMEMMNYPSKNRSLMPYEIAHTFRYIKLVLISKNVEKPLFEDQQQIVEPKITSALKRVELPTYYRCYTVFRLINWLWLVFLGMK